jgi:phthiocerol/phenolphthiocerol synthesis type-I polyketide synthase C
LWGLGRVIMNEHPERACVLIDLQADHLDNEAAAWLSRELLTPDGESEIVLTSDGRFVPRMESAPPPALPAPDTGESGFRLDFSVPGQLRNLHWLPHAPRALAEDEIEIRPAAVGLNFRDVMYAMGLLSDEAVENGFSGASLGLELAGRVSRVGTRVNEFKVGDEVVAFAPACFSSHVVTQAGSAAAKPASWSFEQAATVPTVFFTVYYALKHLANVQPGERVLIHGAAGGVGIAAIQVARYLGAEVFATAGSDEKRDFVHLMGADHVMSSRTLAYADEILALTAGEGVDVVLNSLAGEAINRNFRVLRPFGRFLELGKRDFYENTRIGLRPFKDNISYFGIDADQLMLARPALATRLFREVMALFADGTLRPLPYRAFPATRVVDAFRYMQQARQIGKIVLTLNEVDVPLSQPRRAALPTPPALSAEATYLVSGGIGGFGLRSARWLASLGAGHLVLLGRRGLDTPGIADAVEELEALGALVHVYACDITQREQLAAVMAEIRHDLPPLRGVLHAAMVLDDALLRNLDAARFSAVLAPKAQGAWNLHQLTLDLPLDFFILYSSATTFIGNPGQANYVAANQFLESLAALRRADGLAATCVSWGAIDDVGYLTRHAAVKEGLQARLGGAAIASEQALALLGAMLASDQDGLAVLDFDWHTLQRFLPATQAPRFDLIRRRAGQTSGADEQTEDIRSLIAGRSAEEVLEIVAGLLAGEVAQILQIPADRIDRARSLYDLGMDSLMGMELVLGIEKRFGVTLPVMALNEGPSITRIAERLTASLAAPEADKTEDAQLKDMVHSLAAQHAEAVSSDQIDDTLNEMRRQVRQGARLIS